VLIYKQGIMETKDNLSKGKLEYNKFRVRGHIKSFRDLEIYTQTTEYSSHIFALELPAKIKNKSRLEDELEILRDLAKQVPRLIAEAYGAKFVSKEIAYAKLETAAQYMSNVIAKIDFFLVAVDHEETKQLLRKLIDQYQTQRRKTLNLKRAWIKIEDKFAQHDNNYKPHE